MKTLILAIFSISLLFTSGCIRSETVVYMKKDGSGTITVSESISAAGLQMIQKAGAQAGGPAAMVQEILSIDKAKLQQQARKFGKGITLQKVESIKKPDGSKGRKAVYAFTNINDLTLSPDAPGSEQNTSKSSSIKFSYSGNELQIKIPENPDNDQAEMARMQQMKSVPPQMKVLLAEMFVSVTLKTEQKVSSTNAFYELPDKHGIIINEIAFGKLINDPTAIDELSKIPPSNREKTRAVMKKYPYLKYDNQETITIKF